MSTEERRSAHGIYYTIIDGSFRTKVSEDHPEAVRREYETKDGAKAIKYERIVSAITGCIEDIAIYDGDYGKTINVKLDTNADGLHPIIQFSAGTTYGEDLMKKLPGINFDLPARFAPYCFISEDNGKEMRGVSISQESEAGAVKIGNYFYDTEAKKTINGLPVPEGDITTYDKEDWKIYFLRVRKFLLDYTQNTIIPAIPRTSRSFSGPTVLPDYPEEFMSDNEQPPF